MRNLALSICILIAVSATLLIIGAQRGALGVSIAGVIVSVGLFLVANVIKRGPATPADTLADSLAGAMQAQWTKALRERRLHQHNPLPIKWCLSVQRVAIPLEAATAKPAQFAPLPSLSAMTNRRLRAGGRCRQLHAVYGGLASGRLVITGPAGSGKSASAIQLLLDALDHRSNANAEDRDRIPVPVMFTLHGWDPINTPLRDWLVRKLCEIPDLRKGGAEALLNSKRIAVVLDGLDEIKEELRPTALEALGDQADFRLVLLTRSAEFVKAANNNPLLGPLS